MPFLTPMIIRPFYLTTSKFICLLVLISSCALVVYTQTVTQSQNINSQNSTQDDRHGFGSPAEEMKYRASVHRELSTHKELLDRAEEMTQIGSEIRSAYERNKTLATGDLKKLERMEKLARKIRSSAGGSNDDEELKEPPRQIETAVSRLADLSVIIAKDVKKSSRMVISAGMIENSNELIEIIKHLRTFLRP